MPTLKTDARALTDAKIALEFELMRPLDSIGMNYIRAYEAAGGVPNAHDKAAFERQLEDILLRHYARVVSVFQGQRPTAKTTVESVAKSLAHLESLRARAKRHAGIFFRGLDREFRENMQFGGTHVADGMTEIAFGKAVDWPLEGKDDTTTAPELPEGATVGYWGKLKNAVGKVIGKFKSKIPTIANTNTNPVAEQARALEIVPDAKDATGWVQKEWNSLMDGRERTWHHNAHTQKRPVADPFDVGPDQLRFPGDTELGASLANIINCRCFLVYYHVDNDTGERREIYRGHSHPTRRFRRKPNPKNGAAPGPALNPTTVVTLNGATRARIVLGDARTIATLRQETPSTLVISVGRETIARATIGGGKVRSLTINPKWKDQGLRELIERSAKHSFEMDRRPHAERLPR